MQEYVLSGEEIVRLKHYIEQKHHALTSQQKASILADAVHRTLERRLPSFPAVVKKQLRSELLLKNKEGLTIHVDDVLQQCMSLDLNQETYLFPLASWVCSRSELPLQEESVRQTLAQWSQQPAPIVGLQALERGRGRGTEVNRLEYEAGTEAVVSLREEQWINDRLVIKGVVILTIVIVAMLLPPMERPSSMSAPSLNSIEVTVPVINGSPITRPASGIPAEFRYAPVDTAKLQKYLLSKKSILAEEPYMSAIIKAGKLYDIHPILLFAITGQEQGFVPTTQTKAAEIANNPFNVFGSWESYNTSIEASAAIAAKTVANISSRRPEDNHPIQWLNQTYAEDPNWWKGVTWFFNEMLVDIEGDSFIWKE